MSRFQHTHRLEKESRLIHLAETMGGRNMESKEDAQKPIDSRVEKEPDTFEKKGVEEAEMAKRKLEEKVASYREMGERELKKGALSEGVAEGELKKGALPEGDEKELAKGSMDEGPAIPDITMNYDPDNEVQNAA